MALDKLVDSTQLNSDLTSVANAIRAKSGGSSPLAFPAGFVSEIGNIPSGGGAALIERGTFTPVADTKASEFPVAHSLGVTPDFVIVRTNLDSDTSETTSRIQCAVGFEKDFYTSSFYPGTGLPFLYFVVSNRAGWTQSTENQGAENVSKYMSSTEFHVPYYSSGQLLAGGYTYEYIVGKVVAT